MTDNRLFEELEEEIYYKLSELRIGYRFLLDDDLAEYVEEFINKHLKVWLAVSSTDWHINIVPNTDFDIEYDSEYLYIHVRNATTDCRYRIGEVAKIRDRLQQIEGKEEALTDREKRFAEENHNRIYLFLKANKLDITEYYDIAVMGYLKAVRDYHRKASAREYSFSAVADRSMRDCVYKYWRAEACEKRKSNKGISLDAPMVDDGKESNLHEVVADPRNGIAEAEESMTIEQILSKLDGKGKQIVKMLMDGESKAEIKRTLNITEWEFKSRFDVIKIVVSEVYSR